ncbi:hypothetical protein E8E11_011263 [Didymella keratinophila]|nr:hypothetical protein E8E11_011263 [Didymella keratinophila]
MRDNALLELMDEQIEELRQANAQILAAQVSGHRRPELATSMFRDMPVVKPRSTYTQNEDGQNVYSWCHPAIESQAKILYFPVFKITSEQVQNINAVILNEAYDPHEIVYCKKTSLLHALDFFLRMPSEGFYSLKKNPPETADVRQGYIKQLEKVAEDFDSMILAQSSEAEIKGHTDLVVQEQFLRDHLRQFRSLEPQPVQIFAECMKMPTLILEMTTVGMAMCAALEPYASLEQTSNQMPAQNWTKSVRR